MQNINERRQWDLFTTLIFSLISIVLHHRFFFFVRNRLFNKNWLIQSERYVSNITYSSYLCSGTYPHEIQVPIYLVAIMTWKSQVCDLQAFYHQFLWKKKDMSNRLADRNSFFIQIGWFISLHLCQKECSKEKKLLQIFYMLCHHSKYWMHCTGRH